MAYLADSAASHRVMAHLHTEIDPGIADALALETFAHGAAPRDPRPRMGERLGVTPEWCEAAAKTGEIPSLRVGRYLRFDPAQVLASLQKRRHADRRT